MMRKLGVARIEEVDAVRDCAGLIFPSDSPIRTREPTASLGDGRERIARHDDDHRRAEQKPADFIAARERTIVRVRFFVAIR